MYRYYLKHVNNGVVLEVIEDGGPGHFVGIPCPPEDEMTFVFRNMNAAMRKIKEIEASTTQLETDTTH